MRWAIFSITLCFIVIFLGKSLNPFSNQMFEFHDETQAARIQQFTLNLQNFKIPPRMASDFSFGMGYPIFNFYAPAAYWITSLFHLAGFDAIAALKFSFLLSIIAAFVFSFLFLRNYFRFFPALFGSTIYVSSLYFAVDIFIRGNLAETWFLSIIPLALHVLYKNAKSPTSAKFVLATIVLSVTLTTHNLLSFIFVPVLTGYIFILENKKTNVFALILAFLASSYFLLPLIGEMHLTYAADVAKETKYFLHFLCPNQLWQSDWGFGGSAPGCEQDGMPFKIGKLQLAFFASGILLFITHFTKRPKADMFGIFFIATTIASLFLTTYLSQFLWDLTAPVSAMIQFPWRLISFSLIGIAFFAAYTWEKVRIPYQSIVIFGTMLGIIMINGKYFDRPQLDKKKYEQTYLTEEYIKTIAAYRIPEYLPRTAYYDEWKRLEDTSESFNNNAATLSKDSPFHKTIRVPAGSEVQLPIHYFPTWKIKVNGAALIPKIFDELGRPIVVTKKDSLIEINYQQTTIERIANGISIAIFIFLISLLKFPILWKKLKVSIK